MLMLRHFEQTIAQKAAVDMTPEGDVTNIPYPEHFVTGGNAEEVRAPIGLATARQRRRLPRPKTMSWGLPGKLRRR